MINDKQKSIIRTAKTILPVRCTLAFSELCRAQSKTFCTKSDPKLSSAKFLKQCAIEELKKRGFAEYLKSII